MTSYEVLENEDSVKVIKKIDAEGIVAFIPTDPANSDYQRYLRWLENPDADQPNIEGIN